MITRKKADLTRSGITSEQGVQEHQFFFLLHPFDVKRQKPKKKRNLKTAPFIIMVKENFGKQFFAERAKFLLNGKNEMCLNLALRNINCDRDFQVERYWNSKNVYVARGKKLPYLCVKDK